MKETGFGLIAYGSETELSYPAPASLTVDIPGDQFPAFSNVSIPSVAPLTGVTISTGNTISASSTFTWNAGTNPNGVIEIYFSSGIDFSNPQAPTTDVNCVVVDDGSFSFPAATQAQIGALTATTFDIQRIAFSFVQSGNAFLTLSATSSYQQ